MKLTQSLTFDDVLIRPAYSKILPREVDTKTKFSSDIDINIPIISAAMDTVTEAKLAISISQCGGIGVIHKNNSIDVQVSEVIKVKKYESGMVVDPVTISVDSKLYDLIELKKKFNISGFPVVDKNNRVVGIITNRDIRFETDESLPVKDRMTQEKLVTVQQGTTLEQAKKVLQEHRIEKLLVVDKEGSLAGLITVKDIQKKEDFPNSCKDESGRLRVGAALSVTKDFLERAQELNSKEVDVIVVDTAHGHSAGVLTQIKEIKKSMPELQVIGGNIATADGAKALIDAGADCVKVGIGAGASCTTRIVAGIGVPQLTAVMDCVDEVKKIGIPVIADGGIRYSGDIAKAIAAGADTVMLGSILAGMDESPGEFILFEGRQYKSYRGMGSLGAMQDGDGARYFQDDTEDKKLVPEGIEGIVPYRGSVKNTIHQLMGGLRSSMGYCGGKDILDFQSKAEFIQNTQAGVKESHPHEVKITKEAPNYQISDTK